MKLIKKSGGSYLKLENKKDEEIMLFIHKAIKRNIDYLKTKKEILSTIDSAFDGEVGFLFYESW